jgi:hypothetical protein
MPALHDSRTTHDLGRVDVTCRTARATLHVWLASASLLALACAADERDARSRDGSEAMIEDTGLATNESDAGDSAGDAQSADARAADGLDGATRADANRQADAAETDAASSEAGSQRDAAKPIDAAQPTDAAQPSDAGQPTDATTPREAAITPGGMGSAPMMWKEHWFEHDRNLQLVAQNDWVVLYFDDEVNRANTTWILPFLTRVWTYTVEHYGQFTDGQRDGRLYAIYHQGRYSGGHPSTYFDGSHDFRNVSDVGPGPYPDGSYAISTHEVSHIVEGASRGMHGSPAFGLWGDSKWAEFYQYDLYVALGLSAEAKRVHDEFIGKSDDFPRAGTFWFRDWFYPLWRDHGGVQVMANYFRLLAQHFRKNGVNYGAGMNMGEFVHFMSGAAQTDLKSQASTAFGWSDSREAELVKAQKDFPGIHY